MNIFLVEISKLSYVIVRQYFLSNCHSIPAECRKYEQVMFYICLEGLGSHLIFSLFFCLILNLRLSCEFTDIAFEICFKLTMFYQWFNPICYGAGEGGFHPLRHFCWMHAKFYKTIALKNILTFNIYLLARFFEEKKLHVRTVRACTAPYR